MKSILLISTLVLTFEVLAASITVNPFKVSFYIDQNAYDLDFKLQMACRYEKFIIGDSSEYEYKYKNIPLLITKDKLTNSLIKVTLTNEKQRKLKLEGMFRSNKECQTIQSFFLVSKLYSIGWANQFDRPIRLGIYNQSRLGENKIYDFENIKLQIAEKELGFIYNPTGRQVNIRLGFNRAPSTGMSSYLSTSAFENTKTGMPYPLVKN